MQIIFTTPTKSRPKTNRKLAQANKEHEEYITSVLRSAKLRIPYSTLNIKEKKVEIPLTSLSNDIPYGGYKKSVDDYKWRKGVEETPETIKEIERKKDRLAPAYSKGPVQYISDGADITTLGRKV